MTKRLHKAKVSTFTLREQQVKAMLRALHVHYGAAECALLHRTPFQLLIATILSAQCTDKRVNLVTPELFKRFPTPDRLAKARVSDVEQIIASCGFFRTKAKNIIRCAASIANEFNGEVPRDLETLVRLPGVGRKTANVVLGTAFGIPSGVVVDTHVGRISRRLGLTHQTDPIRVERDLMAILPRRRWISFSHQLIHHGRQICSARSPKCDACPLLQLCPRIGVATLNR